MYGCESPIIPNFDSSRDLRYHPQLLVSMLFQLAFMAPSGLHLAVYILYVKWDAGHYYLMERFRLLRMIGIDTRVAIPICSKPLRQPSQSRIK